MAIPGMARRATLLALIVLAASAAPATAAIELQTKLVPTDELGADGRFGNSVALSSNGDEALIGGWTDNDDAGAAWVYARIGSSWHEIQKLTGTGESSGARFGSAVALSSDGNTAVIGNTSTGPDSTGSARIYTRTGTTWSLFGSTLSPSDPDADGLTEFGSSVALSGDGSTALIGGDMYGFGGGNGE